MITVPAEQTEFDFGKDWDTKNVLEMLGPGRPERLLEVGAHDSQLANLLSAAGWDVTGVDLREYDGEGEPRYRRVRGDWCAMPEDWWRENRGRFDCFVCVSALEHFGMQTYLEGRPSRNYDVFAMRYAWDVLREGGEAFVSVPFGAVYYHNFPHWRLYCPSSVLDRIVQDFTVEASRCFASDDVILGDVKRPAGEPVSVAEASELNYVSPHVSLALKLRKVTGRRRLAPDGR